MDKIDPVDFRPEKVAPLRIDPPGSLTSMPSPTKLHHLHIFSDENYDNMVDFYQRLFNAEIVRPVRLFFPNSQMRREERRIPLYY